MTLTPLEKQVLRRLHATGMVAAPTVGEQEVCRTLLVRMLMAGCTSLRHTTEEGKPASRQLGVGIFLVEQWAKGCKG